MNVSSFNYFFVVVQIPSKMTTVTKTKNTNRVKTALSETVGAL